MFVRRYFGRHHIPSYFGRLRDNRGASSLLYVRAEEKARASSRFYPRCTPVKQPGALSFIFFVKKLGGNAHRGKQFSRRGSRPGLRRMFPPGGFPLSAVLTGRPGILAP